VCVECRSALGSRRTPYCGRRCQWKFRGRYFWDAARTFVLYRDRYTCQVCRKKHRARDLEVDHVREIAAGGPTLEYANLQAICRPCHRLKTRTFLRARSARGAAPATDASGEGYWLEWFPT
jgi:5-methylcytosine-specific restriction protein A